jgi:hypothetical protein
MTVDSSEPLEAQLRSLSARLAHPPTPDLAASVGAALRSGPAASSRSVRWWDRPGVARIAAAIVALAAAVLLVSPAARDAVASVFRGVRGIRIVVGSPSTGPPSASVVALTTPAVSVSPPTSAPQATTSPATASVSGPPATASPSSAALSVGPAPRLAGTPTTLSAVRRVVPFVPLLPAALGPPDRVLLERNVARGTVTMVWTATPALPRAAGDVGAVLTEFKPDFADNFPYWLKTVEGEADLRDVLVNGTTGTWIEGGHRLDFRIPTPTGFAELATSRIAANTLIWIQNGITIRLETALPLDAALKIAESMR